MAHCCITHERKMIKVTLREKAIAKGRRSLYLDFYPAVPHPKTGKPTRREFLGIYIYEKPKDSLKKLSNSQTLRFAESVRQKKENELNKPEIYTEFEKQQLRIKRAGEKNFVSYFQDLVNKRKGSNSQNWASALKYLEAYTGGILIFADITVEILEDFKMYLLTTPSFKTKDKPLSQNSASSYFNKIKVALKQAYKEDILQTYINAKIKTIPEKETRREFLTMEELNKVAQTPFPDDLLKRASLFACLTGLGFAEVRNLTWGDLSLIKKDQTLMISSRQKTEKDNYLPISEQALEICGEPGDPATTVFTGLTYSVVARKVKELISNAGIDKDITFHCFRHTYATLQLTHGTDIYTLSKMLGHSSLKTTQVYAKVIDETKRVAANRITLTF